MGRGLVTRRSPGDAARPVRSEPLDPVPHSTLEDALAIVTATAFVSLGTGLLKHLGLLTGGSAGIALLLSRVTPFTFGQVFLAVNVPFFWLGVRQMGWPFTGKTFASYWLHNGLLTKEGKKISKSDPGTVVLMTSSNGCLRPTSAPPTRRTKHGSKKLAAAIHLLNAKAADISA